MNWLFRPKRDVRDAHRSNKLAAVARRAQLQRALIAAQCAVNIALAIALAWNWNSSGWGWDGYFAGGDSPGPADVAPANAAAMQALNGTPELAAAAFAAPAEPATRTAAVAAFAARYYNGVPGDRDLWEEERVVEPVYRRREIQVDHSCAVHDPVAPFPPQGINPVEFWAVWEGWWFFEEDHYRFTATARDGVRLYVDGALIVDEWTVKAAPEATSALKTLRCGRHLVRIEYFTRAARRTGALPAIPEATPVSTWRDTARDFSRCQLRVRWERDPHRLKIFVYDLPPRFHVGVAEKNPKCEHHMFAAEVRMYENMLRSAARTLDAEAADFFYVPVLSSCKYLPKPYFGVDPWFGEKQINRAIGYIQRWPYWARTQGQDHIFTITYDYGACFEYKEDKADARGVNRHLFAPIILSSLGYARTRCFQPWKDIVVPTVSSDPLLWREARGGDSPLTLGLPGHEDDAEQYATARASLDAALRRIRARGWAVAQGGGGVWGEPGHDAALRGGGLRAPAPSATTRTPLAVHVHGSATPGARETDEFALPDWMVGAGIGGDTVLTAALGNETGLLRRLGTTWQPDAFGGRDTFLHFQGTFEWFDKDPDYSKGVRQTLKRLRRADPLLRMRAGKSETYVNDLRRSVFCACPLGFAPWSPRIYEAVMTGCIPVIISDHIRLPFDDILDWRKFSVKIPENDVSRIRSILLSIPLDAILEKQRRLREVWKAFTWQQPAARGDAFHYVLQELRLRLRGDVRRKFATEAGTWI